MNRRFFLAILVSAVALPLVTVPQMVLSAKDIKNCMKDAFGDLDPDLLGQITVSDSIKGLSSLFLFLFSKDLARLSRVEIRDIVVRQAIQEHKDGRLVGLNGYFVPAIYVGLTILLGRK